VVRIGTCGFPEAHRTLFADFDLLEVQQTFYQPPRIETAQRWRSEAPADFVFTLKAWQLLTHEAGSPTYRRLREGLSPEALREAGGLRWNALTRMAWARTQAIADALEAEAVVFQTPRRFVPEEENIRRLRRFFAQIDRRGRRMVFEPRGEAWSREILAPLLRELDLVHGVDPFLRRPVGRGLRYLRLHGRPAYHYHYRYTDEDLRVLAGMLNRAWPNWVLFNNDTMAADARRLQALLASA